MASTSFPVACRGCFINQDNNRKYRMERWKHTKQLFEDLLPFPCLILQVKKIESGHLVEKVSQILKFLEEDPNLPELLIDQLNEKPRIPESDRYLMLTMVDMSKRNKMLDEKVLEILQVKETLEKIHISVAGMKRYLDKTDVYNMRDDVIGYIERQHSRQIVRNLLQTSDKLKEGLMFFFEIAMETKILVENLGFFLAFSADFSNKNPYCCIPLCVSICDLLFQLENMNKDGDFETFCSCIESTFESFLGKERNYRTEILHMLRDTSNFKRQVMEINDKGIPSSTFSGIFCGCFKFNNRETKRINGQKLSMEDSKLESTSPWCSSQGNSNQKDIVVGLEGMLKITATLVQSGPSGLEILTIVGMAGIGKSTLANKIFNNPIIYSHFDCRAWVTACEDYKVTVSLTGYEKDDESMTDMAKNLSSCLKGKRYLVVIDNMLSVEALDAVRQFFPDDKNESRILLTTKSMQLATAANPNSTMFCMNLLNECQSLEFLKKELFGRKSCPPELLDIGKQITKKCLGLPSALAHVAKLLFRILTHDWWLFVENSLNLIECRNPEEYQKILSLDFDQLSSTWRDP